MSQSGHETRRISLRVITFCEAHPFKATVNCLLCKEITRREEMVCIYTRCERGAQMEDLIPELHEALADSASLATCIDFIRTHAASQASARSAAGVYSEVEDSVLS